MTTPAWGVAPRNRSCMQPSTARANLQPRCTDPVYRGAVKRAYLMFPACLIAACTASKASGPGSMATGDAAGSSDGAPPSTDGSPAGPCNGAAVCDDFESAAVGSIPGAPCTVARPSCSGSGTLAIDDSQAHSGTRSLMIRGGSTYCDHVFLASAAPAALTGALYARFFV